MAKTWTIILSILVQSATSVASEDPSRTNQIRFHNESKILFVCGKDVAEATGFEFKAVSKSLVTFCRGDDNAFCTPVRLTATNHRVLGGKLMISAKELGKALRYSVTEASGRIVVQKNTDRPDDDSLRTAGYISDWGKGRGFEIGETLPDIPLVDLDGAEVRFSRFLGKRYILYVWASW